MQLALMNGLKVLFKHFIQIKHKCLGCAIGRIYYLFKGHLYSQVNLVVLLHCFDV